MAILLILFLFTLENKFCSPDEADIFYLYFNLEKSSMFTCQAVLFYHSPLVFEF